MTRRIAHVISTPRGLGGAERVLETLVAGSVERGIEVRVFNPFDEDPRSSALGDLLGARYRARTRPTLLGLASARSWLRAELAAFAPQVVHAHLFHAAALVATLPRSVAPRRLLSQHHGRYFAWLDRPWMQRLDDAVTRRFDIVVPCSHAVAAEIPLPRARVRVVHNGWRGTPAPPTFRDPANVVACIANLRQEKDHATLIHAFRAVVDVRPDVRLILAGDGPLRSETASLVASLELGGHVELRGSVPDAWAVLQEADVFALSSAFEPLGIAVIEAMAAGLPVVATSAGGIPELIRHGDSGLLVASHDAPALTSTLLRVLEDSALRRSLGERALAAASELHVDRMVESYHRVYDDVTVRVPA